MIKLIILDFDGVIIESVDVKTKAFAAMFADQPEIAQRFMAYHLANNGKSRFNKFEWLYKNVLKKPLTNEIKKELGDKFSKLVFEQVVECPYVTGALDFLEEFHADLPVYVASITPQAELEAIMEKRSLGKYFKKIIGGTGKKSALINQILHAENIDPQDVLFVGDTMEDYLASQETGVGFVARVRQEKFEQINVPKFKDMKQIRNYLKGV